MKSANLFQQAKVHYVIAAWSGDRRRGNDPYVKDRTYYLKKHLDHLSTYKHDLAAITIVAPDNDDEPSYFADYLTTIPEKVQNTPVSVVRRPNKGQSYGSYSDIYGRHRTSFDYYIFIEDDYAFVKDHFDLEMIMLFEMREKCGFLCSLATPWSGKMHAAISNGISRSDILERIYEKFGEFPHKHIKKSFDSYDCGPQLNFSYSFLDVGTKICDYLDTYKSPFNHAGKLKFFGEPSKESLIVPLQFDLARTI